MTYVHFLGVNPRPHPQSWPTPKHNFQSVSSNLMIYLLGLFFVFELFFFGPTEAVSRDNVTLSVELCPHVVSVALTHLDPAGQWRKCQRIKRKFFVRHNRVYFCACLKHRFLMEYYIMVNHNDSKRCSHFLPFFIPHLSGAAWHHLRLKSACLASSLAHIRWIFSHFAVQTYFLAALTINVRDWTKQTQNQDQLNLQL